MPDNIDPPEAGDPAYGHDPLDKSGWPSPRGPWPEVRDLTQLYDHGRRWCVNAAGHPGHPGHLGHPGHPGQPGRDGRDGRDGGGDRDWYSEGSPDPLVHVPWHECRSPEQWLEGPRFELDGPRCEAAVYAASPFRFGQVRENPVRELRRVVFEVWQPEAEKSVLRFSLAVGEAVRLARVLNRLVDSIVASPGS